MQVVHHDQPRRPIRGTPERLENGEEHLEALGRIRAGGREELGLHAATKARKLTRRGVRRIFCLVVKQKKLIEWSRATDGWAATPLEAIDDPCFVRPLPTLALLQAAAADGAVLRALRMKGHPEIEAVREEGREEGRVEGLRVGILDICDTLGIPVTSERRRTLDGMRASELDAMRVALKRERRWPR